MRERDEQLPFPEFSALTVAMVALGGGVGAIARYGLLLGFPIARDGFPAGALVVNLVGSLLLGIVLGWFDTSSGRDAPAWLRPLILAGFLGSFTTLSLVVVDHAILIAEGRGLEALASTLATLIGTVIAAFLGIVIGHRIGNRTGTDAR